MKKILFTSLKVTSDMVDMLIFRSFVELFLFARDAVAGDITPFEFSRRSGDEKSSRNVIK